MKARKGFKKITVEGKIYQYAASRKLIVYDEADKKYEMNLAPLPDNVMAWEVKFSDAPWGTKNVATVIKNYFNKK